MFGFWFNLVHVLTLRIQFLNFFLFSNFLDYFFILHGALHQNLRFSIHINLWRSYYLIILSFVLANFNILIFEFRIFFNYLNTAHYPLSINTRVNRTIYGHWSAYSDGTGLMVGFWSCPQILPLHISLFLLFHEVVIGDLSLILNFKSIHLGVVLIDGHEVSLVLALLAIGPWKRVVLWHIYDFTPFLALSPFIVESLYVF